MALSQREAARVWGVSRAMIQRAISAGELSVTGDKLIDPAELLRVFGPAKSRSAEPFVPPTEPAGPDPAQAAQLAALRAENTALRELLEAKDANLADLRSQVRLLTHDGAPRRRWWPFR